MINYCLNRYDMVGQKEVEVELHLEKPRPRRLDEIHKILGGLIRIQEFCIHRTEWRWIIGDIKKYYN